MFYSIKGIITHTTPGVAVLECGGVGFKCMTTMNTQSSLPAVGETAQLYTYLNVREDALDLFGFYDLEELHCFKLLIAVSGVGPKAALAVLSELTPSRFALSVAGGDSKTLTRAQGVGPKLAQRIVLELKDKLSAGLTGGDTTVSSGQPSASGNVEEAVSALSVLGFGPAESAPILAKLDAALPPGDLVRLALKQLGSQ